MTHQVVYINGKAVTLAKRIGRGGEGDVYSLSDGSDRAIKLYTTGDIAARERKVTAMVQGQLASQTSLVAFPEAVATHKNGRFAGFMMKLVKSHHPVHELYAPKARKQNFPAADYRFLVRTAANIARAVASVHKAGCVIGDINHSGVLISDRATAALIDADSFQYVTHNTRFPCVVGVPEYTPPELQGKSLREVTRTPNHDAFGLAVTIFLLLFMGRHPFMGAYAHGEMPIERAIAERRFVYSRQRNVGMTPPPGVSTLDDFPEALGSAFESAFSNDLSQERPAASRWVAVLEELERSLRQCATNELHYYSSAAKSCPWCRMENQMGFYLFVPHVVGAQTGLAIDPGAASFNLGAVWSAIEAVKVLKVDAIEPKLPTIGVKPSAKASEARSAQLNKRIFGWLLVAGAVAGFFFLPKVWYIFIPLAWVGLAWAFGKGETPGEFRKSYDEADKQYAEALTSWYRRVGYEELITLRASLPAAKERYEGFAAEEERRKKSYYAKRRSIHLENFLDQFLIRRTKIKGIGPAKTAALASYGIETAADIEKYKVLAVPGFGEVTLVGLMEWRRRCEAKFRYDERPNAMDQQELQKIKAAINAEGAKLRGEMTSGLNSLRKLATQLEKFVKIPDPVLARYYAARCQAEADLKHLGLQVPATVAKKPTFQAKAQRSSTSAAPRVTVPSSLPPSCPLCGTSMRKRIARRGRGSGRPFWGCSRYPSCRGTRSI